MAFSSFRSMRPNVDGCIPTAPAASFRLSPATRRLDRISPTITAR
jgi:hypothetical protein